MRPQREISRFPASAQISHGSGGPLVENVLGGSTVLSSEIEIFNMLFDRCHRKNTEYFNFLCKIQLNQPVQLLLLCRPTYRVDEESLS